MRHYRIDWLLSTVSWSFFLKKLLLEIYIYIYISYYISPKSILSAVEIVTSRNELKAFGVAVNNPLSDDWSQTQTTHSTVPSSEGHVAYRRSKWLQKDCVHFMWTFEINLHWIINTIDNVINLFHKYYGYVLGAAIWSHSVSSLTENRTWNDAFKNYVVKWYTINYPLP